MTINTVTLNTGVVMPAMGFGVFQTPPEATADAVAEALRVGYRLIDTAAAYGNEREVGAAIRRSGLDRDEVFIETQPDKLETWRRCSFDVFFKGDDWRGTPQGDELERRFAAVGVQVVYFPYTVHTSSTKLRRALTLLESPSEDLETLVLES